MSEIREKMVQSIRLVSVDSCFGPAPAPGTEIEQHLTLSRTGRIWFSGYSCTEDYAGSAKLSRKVNCKIPTAHAEAILCAVAAHFPTAPQCWATDIGMWGLQIRYTDGSVADFAGSMCYEIEASIDGVPLDAYIRKTLPIEKLFLFEAKYEEAELD